MGYRSRLHGPQAQRLSGVLAMIQVDHYVGGSLSVAGLECAYPLCRNRLSCDCDYALGLEPPRYPVPAIPLYVCLTPTKAIVAEIEYIKDGKLQSKRTLTL